ncbi:uncharacterized protein L969DRAFT_84450 [Mixia osmundae IAM 14324]|nr:uncharacterized protein L969DRAFT_84450 [Mixia osmundae IAM 14324]KEI42573.1 hypothetical protein L969DRAFT_84450 [Mixia osmundae IAM 14324]
MCQGVIVCQNPDCSITSLKPSKIIRCPGCDRGLSKSTCSASSTLISDSSGWIVRFRHSGIHEHERPPAAAPTELYTFRASDFVREEEPLAEEPFQPQRKRKATDASWPVNTSASPSSASSSSKSSRASGFPMSSRSFPDGSLSPECNTLHVRPQRERSTSSQTTASQSARYRAHSPSPLMDISPPFSGTGDPFAFDAIPYISTPTTASLATPASTLFSPFNGSSRSFGTPSTSFDAAWAQSLDKTSASAAAASSEADTSVLAQFLESLSTGQCRTPVSGADWLRPFDQALPRRPASAPRLESPRGDTFPSSVHLDKRDSVQVKFDKQHILLEEKRRLEAMRRETREYLNSIDRRLDCLERDMMQIEIT